MKHKFFSIIQTFLALLVKIIENPLRIFALPKELFNFLCTYIEFKSKYNGSIDIFFRPIFFQRNVDSKFDAHYVIQAWWASSRIKKISPLKHIDVSSNVGYVAQLAAMIPVEFYEFNPPHLILPGLFIKKASLGCLPFKDNTVRSLSCLHVLEHIGLGRYGDPIDPDGMTKACHELSRVIKSGGHLLVSFPIGRERIEFNSQRVINPSKALLMFPRFFLKEFSLVNDKRQFIKNADIKLAANERFACGMYHLVKS